MKRNQLKTLPNIKESHSRQLFNQHKPSGTLPGASDPSSRPQIDQNCSAQHGKSWEGRGRCVKIQGKPSKHHPNIKTTTTKQFPTKKVNRGPSRRCLAQFQKISDFGKFRVWKSYFQNFPDFFQKRWTEKTLLHRVSTSNETIFAEKNQV